MLRHLLLSILLAGTAAASTRLVPVAPSRLVLHGSSNVAPWRCSGTALEGAMEVAVPLQQINTIIDRIEDGDVARLDPAKASFPPPAFRLTIPVSTLRCGNRQMERDMAEALRADAHPSIEFRFRGLASGVTHDIDAGSYRATILGVLSLAGARREVAVEVEARRLAPNRFRLTARLPLRMTDFGIIPPTALFGMVKAKNDLAVDFDLILQGAHP